MKLFDAARKSIVACVSDFAAKGIQPQYGIICKLTKIYFTLKN